MKRFWASATAVREGNGWQVQLDGRPLRTPGKHLLAVPSAALAAAIAGEWAAIDTEVAPALLPLTGLANAAIDLVQPDRDSFLVPLNRYAAFDLLCYRAEHPAALVERQEQQWEPLLLQAEERHSVRFLRQRGVVPVAQPAETIAALAAALARHDDFSLAALEQLIRLSGSLVVALAVAAGTLSAERGFAAATLDEEWQQQQWGADAEAARVLAERRRAFLAAARLLALLAEPGAAS